MIFRVNYSKFGYRSYLVIRCYTCRISQMIFDPPQAELEVLAAQFRSSSVTTRTIVAISVRVGMRTRSFAASPNPAPPTSTTMSTARWTALPSTSRSWTTSSPMSPSTVSSVTPWTKCDVSRSPRKMLLRISSLRLSGEYGASSLLLPPGIDTKYTAYNMG